MGSMVNLDELVYRLFALGAPREPGTHHAVSVLPVGSALLCWLPAVT